MENSLIGHHRVVVFSYGIWVVFLLAWMVSGSLASFWHGNGDILVRMGYFRKFFEL